MLNNIRKLLLQQRNAIFITKLHASCWFCGKQHSNAQSLLFCPFCNTIQKPDNSKNYFDLIGVTKTFDIDRNELVMNYKDLQRLLHPDKFAQRKKEERMISEEYSSLVNEAYKTLLEPLSRGLYMLELNGKYLSENTEMDQEFLLEVMEKNEQVQEANTDEELLNLNKEIKEKLNTLTQEVSQNFKKGDLNAVLKLLSRMKYYTSIGKQIYNAIRMRGIIE